MNKTKKALLLAVLVLFSIPMWSQMTPPGLGKANTAFWGAFGVKSKLDTINKREMLTYVGYGTKSDMDNYNPFQKGAQFVFDNEITTKLANNQQYSYALSYRRSTVFDSKEPYTKTGIEQEFRAYGKYAYTMQFNRFKWKNTFRQEFRKFFDADFSESKENLQLRTRLKTQITYKLADKNNQNLSFSAEALFKTSLMNGEKREWTTFGYSDTRLGLFYSTDIPSTPLTMDIGYVNNLIRGNKDQKAGVHYLSFDLVWKL